MRTAEVRILIQKGDIRMDPRKRNKTKDLHQKVAVVIVGILVFMAIAIGTR
jgi:hypothetical protein